MAQTLAANAVTLHDLKQAFGIQRSQDPAFFPEWQQDGDVLQAAEEQQLGRAKANFEALMEVPPLPLNRCTE